MELEIGEYLSGTLRMDNYQNHMFSTPEEASTLQSPLKNLKSDEEPSLSDIALFVSTAISKNRMIRNIKAVRFVGTWLSL